MTVAVLPGRARNSEHLQQGVPVLDVGHLDGLQRPGRYQRGDLSALGLHDVPLVLVAALDPLGDHLAEADLGAGGRDARFRLELVENRVEHRGADAHGPQLELPVGLSGAATRGQQRRHPADSEGRIPRAREESPPGESTRCLGGLLVHFAS